MVVAWMISVMILYLQIHKNVHYNIPKVYYSWHMKYSVQQNLYCIILKWRSKSIILIKYEKQRLLSYQSFFIWKNQLMIFLCKSPDLLQGLKVFTLVYEFYKLFVGGCICVLLTCVLWQLTSIVYVVYQLLIDVVRVTQHIYWWLQNCKDQMFFWNLNSSVTNVQFFTNNMCMYLYNYKDL